MALLRSVRAKLTTLVGLSAAATLVALPVLHQLMSRQLIDVVDDRVPEAVRGFDLEMADDVNDLEAATRSLAESEELERALDTKDKAKALDELKVFHEAYPGIALIALTSDAKPLADLGLPSFDAREGVAGRADLDGGAEMVRGIRRKGCSTSPSPRPAYTISRGVKTKGYIVACMTIDEAYLANASEKLGVELALTDETGKIAVQTPGFPVAGYGRWNGTSDPIDEGGHAWALARFEPAPLHGMKKAFPVTAALDMTRVRGVVRRNLGFTVGVLLAAAIAAIILGARVAAIMSRALARLNVAYKKLEKDEYVHVTGVETGDEIEALASGFNTMVDGLRERDKLRTTMGKYMTQSVMDHLMRGKVSLGGETLTVTILFTDIRSFTSISETMSAHDLVTLLNEYFTDMVSIVMEEDGVVDKYIGDAIMAVFGAPVPKPDDAVRAVRAAVRMRKALAVLNERLAERGRPTLKTGIGLHTGEVVAGNIGSEARMEYTVIGDAVNLASRLESATKELGADVLISDDTYALVKDHFETRAVREITVKGRHKPVTVYEVLADKGTGALTKEERDAIGPPSSVGA